MQLIVKDVQIPEQITFNYEELKAEIAERLEVYSSMVYTDDNIKAAKADKATLNKLKKALNDERIRRKKEYLAPFEEFESKLNEIIRMVDKPILMIDSQIKAVDEQRKQEKADGISEYYENASHPEWLELIRIFDNKWLNVTYSMKQIEKEIDERLEQIARDIETIQSLPEFSFEAFEVYKERLDLNRAINEGRRLAELQKRKQEIELAKTHEEAKNDSSTAESFPSGVRVERTSDGKLEIEEVAQWISFKAKLTVAQAVELKEFFNRRNIEFKAIGE